MSHSPRVFWLDESGMTTVEYALLLTLVAVVAIAAWAGVGGRVRGSAVDAGQSVKHTVLPGG